MLSHFNKMKKQSRGIGLSHASFCYLTNGAQLLFGSAFRFCFQIFFFEMILASFVPGLMTQYHDLWRFIPNENNSWYVTFYVTFPTWYFQIVKNPILLNPTWYDDRPPTYPQSTLTLYVALFWNHFLLRCELTSPASLSFATRHGAKWTWL